MPNCPAVVQYKIVFENGEVKFPKLPGSADVVKVASNYAKEKNTTVVSISVIR